MPWAARSSLRGSRSRVRGRFHPPGDKSLSHRALLLAALAGGRTELEALNPGSDVEATAGCLRALGIDVRRRGRRWTVTGGGRDSLRRPAAALDCGNSGTTMRLMAGIRTSAHGACLVTSVGSMELTRTSSSSNRRVTVSTMAGNMSPQINMRILSLSSII